MQLIFLLLALFAISCVLYGISAGVQSIQRGLSWLARRVNGDASRATNAPTSTAPSAAAAEVPAALVPSPAYVHSAEASPSFETSSRCISRAR